MMKTKLVGAKKGHSLLKKKADALTARLRKMLRNILEVKDEMGKSFKLGNFALAEVKYAAGDIKPMVIESVKEAQKKVETRIDNIAGVKVPVFKAVDCAVQSYDHTGLSKGGQQIAKVPGPPSRPPPPPLAAPLPCPLLPTPFAIPVRRRASRSARRSTCSCSSRRCRRRSSSSTRRSR